MVLLHKCFVEALHVEADDLFCVHNDVLTLNRSLRLTT
jgi:hypothetical protein